MMSHDLQNLQGLDYTVKTKVFLERLMDFELRAPEDRSVFYEDPSTSFPRLLFHGQEWSLWQLELLVFAFVDMLATDYVLAAVITALITGVSLIIINTTHYYNSSCTGCVISTRSVQSQKSRQQNSCGQKISHLILFNVLIVRCYDT